MKENNLLILNKIKLSYFHEGIFIKKKKIDKIGAEVELTKENVKTTVNAVDNELKFYEAPKEAATHTSDFNLTVKGIRGKFNLIPKIAKLQAGTIDIKGLQKDKRDDLKKDINDLLIAPLQEIEKASELDKAKKKFNNEKEAYDKQLKAYEIDTQNTKKSYEEIKIKAINEKYLEMKLPDSLPASLKEAIIQNFQPIVDRLKPGVIKVPDVANFTKAEQYEKEAKKITKALTKFKEPDLATYLKSTQLKGIFDQQRDIINTYNAIDEMHKTFTPDKLKALGISVKFQKEIEALKTSLKKPQNLDNILAKSKVLQTKISVAILKKQIEKGSKNKKEQAIFDKLKKNPALDNLLTRYARGNMDKITNDQRDQLKSLLTTIKDNPDLFGYINLQLDSAADGYKPSASIQAAKKKKMDKKIGSLIGPGPDYKINPKYATDANVLANYEDLKKIREALVGPPPNSSAWSGIDSDRLKDPKGPMNLLYAYGRAMDTGLHETDLGTKGLTHKLSLYNTKSKKGKDEYRYAFIMNINVDDLPGKTETPLVTLKREKDPENPENKGLIGKGVAIITEFKAETWYIKNPKNKEYTGKLTAVQVPLDKLKKLVNHTETPFPDPKDKKAQKKLIAQIRTTRATLTKGIKEMRSFIGTKNKVDPNEKPAKTKLRLEAMKKAANTTKTNTNTVLDRVTNGAVKNDPEILTKVTAVGKAQEALDKLLKQNPGDQAPQKKLIKDIEKAKGHLQAVTEELDDLEKAKLKAAKEKEDQVKDEMGEHTHEKVKPNGIITPIKYKKTKEGYIVAGIKRPITKLELEIFLGLSTSESAMEALVKKKGLIPSCFKNIGSKTYSYNSAKGEVTLTLTSTFGSGSQNISYNIKTGVKTYTNSKDIKEFLATGDEGKTLAIVEELKAKGIDVSSLNIDVVNEGENLKNLKNHLKNKEWDKALQLILIDSKKPDAQGTVNDVGTKETIFLCVKNLKAKIKGKTYINELKSALPAAEFLKLYKDKITNAFVNTLKDGYGEKLTGTMALAIIAKGKKSEIDKAALKTLIEIEGNSKVAEIANVYVEKGWDAGVNTDKNLEAIKLYTGEYKHLPHTFIKANLTELEKDEAWKGRIKTTLATASKPASPAGFYKEIYEKLYNDTGKQKGAGKELWAKYHKAIGTKELIKTGIEDFDPSVTSAFIDQLLVEVGTVNLGTVDASNADKGHQVYKRLKNCSHPQAIILAEQLKTALIQSKHFSGNDKEKAINSTDDQIARVDKLVSIAKKEAKTDEEKKQKEAAIKALSKGGSFENIDGTVIASKTRKDLKKIEAQYNFKEGNIDKITDTKDLAPNQKEFVELYKKPDDIDEGKMKMIFDSVRKGNTIPKEAIKSLAAKLLKGGKSKFHAARLLKLIGRKGDAMDVVKAIPSTVENTAERILILTQLQYIDKRYKDIAKLDPDTLEKYKQGLLLAGASADLALTASITTHKKTPAHVVLQIVEQGRELIPNLTKKADKAAVIVAMHNFESLKDVASEPIKQEILDDPRKMKAEHLTIIKAKIARADIAIEAYQIKKKLPTQGATIVIDTEILASDIATHSKLIMSQKGKKLDEKYTGTLIEMQQAGDIRNDNADYLTVMLVAAYKEDDTQKRSYYLSQIPTGVGKQFQANSREQVLYHELKNNNLDAAKNIDLNKDPWKSDKKASIDKKRELLKKAEGKLTKAVDKVKIGKEYETLKGDEDYKEAAKLYKAADTQDADKELLRLITDIKKIKPIDVKEIVKDMKVTKKIYVDIVKKRGGDVNGLKSEYLKKVEAQTTKVIIDLGILSDPKAPSKDGLLSVLKQKDRPVKNGPNVLTVLEAQTIYDKVKAESKRNTAIDDQVKKNLGHPTLT